MKALPTLLRLARRQLDELQRALGVQTSKRLAVEERIRAHEQTIRNEQQAALRDYEAHRAYGGFAAVALAGRKALEAEIVAIDEQADKIRALIAEAHVEMRKFERLLELQDERERNAAAKREDAELDEMATLRAGRNMTFGG